jgi:segregation and condensation protein A
VPYQVATPVFEGPFDLLLHLITKEQVDIYEVNLATIVDAYLSELERMQAALDLELATEFLLIAAILVELKTRRLLPGRDDVDLDEEFALWEERDLLLARLLECQTFKQAARELERLGDRAARSFPRMAGLEDQFLSLAPDPLAGLTVEKLRAACLRALTPKPVPTVDTEHLAPIRISVQEVVEGLVNRLPALGRATFRQLTAAAPDRLTVIASFLGVLELVKQGLVDLEQATNFGELEVIWIGDAGVELDPLAVEDYAG